MAEQETGPTRTKDGSIDGGAIGATNQERPAPIDANIIATPQVSLPKPHVGSGSHDLATESSDPEILRQHLERARERLTFYESFDRIIGENIRRSGELMLETITLREEAQERDRVVARLEDERNAARIADQDRNKTLLGNLLNEADRALSGLTDLRARLAGALNSIGEDSGHDAVAAQVSGTERETAVPTFGSTEPITAAAGAVTDVAKQTDPSPSGSVALATAELSPLQVTLNPASTSASGPEAATTIDEAAGRASERAPDLGTGNEGVKQTPTASVPETVAEPSATARRVDVLLHGVPRAAVALSLQRYLKTLPGVRVVETREFAEGVLRLNVTTVSPSGLTHADFAGWEDSDQISVLSEQETVLELSLSQSSEL